MVIFMSDWVTPRAEHFVDISCKQVASTNDKKRYVAEIAMRSTTRTVYS